MTKKNKQLILIAVLSLTLYAVWPSDHSRQPERETDTSNVRPVSLQSRDREAKVKPNAMPVLKKRNTVAIDRRQRWSIDEILRNNPFQGTGVTVTEPSKANGDVQAIYFSSPVAGISAASAVVGGRVVSQGQRLSPDRTVLEIRETGIAVGR
ncbi:hypothetical protein [Neorhodopirellula pilleata]|uniref:Uncharacterized protein n=1 Tax=Neorhodopirellula pilleata TaxID=2714738 RepID=A0A5C6A8C0_9BACT|nr:hypothetical protein [Neorhodopirellula pilleata]TWT95630.1 hypothetical protein Pla100_32710 [Neorhodopirellula pilleata]